MSVKWTSVILLIQLSFYFSSGSCGKVLVWAAEYSHWMNMKTILEELVQRGHEVTVLASSASIVFDPNNSSALKIEVYPTSLTKTEFENIITQEIKRWSDLPKDSFWLYFSQMQEIMWRFGDIRIKFCKDVVSNKKLMKKLQESRFDVVLADPVFPGSELLAELFNIPLVYSLRFSPGYVFEKHSVGFIFPPSYVPVVMSELSDQMTFMERVKNMIYMLYFDFCFQLYDLKKWNQFYSEVLVAVKGCDVVLSIIYYDQSLKPLDQKLFWIEFVMNHNGAKVPAATYPQPHLVAVLLYGCAGLLGSCLLSLSYYVLDY
ncbi:UDP-glucuronosyltransferase 2B33-like [Rhinopithecus roxellana]|uniref:UDP-glucuronosyltransferase 2B33-like n=1 Tax=Rhinopithecus roxellana TaxID=61622 RepID=UPI0012371C9D|nr:UDP-glucuronosyltransferase 2B33-like [Rhinopithecus roxellana]